MNPSSPELKSELEAFRERWLSEVKSKRPSGPHRAAAPGPSHSRAASSAAAPASPPLTKAHLTTAGPARAELSQDDDQIQPPAFDEILEMAAEKKGKEADVGEGAPVSALDHFEAAVVREAQGKLGDSLDLYRKAFRMDSSVDQAYRRKHFPAAAKPPSHPLPAAAPAPAPAPAPKAPAAQSTPDLISTFQNLSIVPLAPEIEGDPPPPCPIAFLPDELLSHILTDLALLDVADFARLAQVCKRLAHLVATEQHIWRSVCLDPRFGFAGMHHRFRTSITWGPLPDEPPAVPDELLPPTEDEQRARDDAQKLAASLALHPVPYPTWSHMFRHRPRVRFNGCYISTVNYMRSGQSSASHVTWNSPVHIVTYHRYLRFFRDGSAASLLTVAEPADVVPHLTRDALALQRGAGAPHLPSHVVRDALRGRWRLGEAGDVVVETEGAAERYVYRMDLSLRSAGKAARNNKLVWGGFYSYNKLADDWGEFLRRNERPFFFSRVRSYGVGE